MSKGGSSGVQWRNFGLKSGGDKNFVLLFGSVYSTPRSVGGETDLVGGWGQGGPGERP
jgi:hypothetical protein